MIVLGRSSVQVAMFQLISSFLALACLRPPQCHHHGSLSHLVTRSWVAVVILVSMELPSGYNVSPSSHFPVL